MSLKIRFRKDANTKTVEVADGAYLRLFNADDAPFDLDPDWETYEMAAYENHSVLELSDDGKDEPTTETKAEEATPDGEAKVEEAKPKTAAKGGKKSG